MPVNPHDSPTHADDDDPEIIIGGLRIDILEGAFSWYIRSLEQVVSRDLENRTKNHEISRRKGRITALLLVDDYPGIRPSQIADVLLRDRPSTGRLIDSLVDAGWIMRGVSSDDQRAQSLTITETGHAQADELRAIIRQQEDEFFDFIPEEDRAQFLKMLKKAYLNMRKKVS